MTEKPDKPNAAPPPLATPPRLQVRNLLAGHREAVLEFDGQDYRLRITSTGKLILTK